jgi:hypothetical protein
VSFLFDFAKKRYPIFPKEIQKKFSVPHVLLLIEFDRKAATGREEVGGFKLRSSNYSLFQLILFAHLRCGKKD